MSHGLQVSFGEHVFAQPYYQRLWLGGGGGATHRSWVVKSGAVASHYGRRPSCLLSPNRVGSGSGWSSLWQPLHEHVNLHVAFLATYFTKELQKVELG